MINPRLRGSGSPPLEDSLRGPPGALPPALLASWSRFSPGISRRVSNSVSWNIHSFSLVRLYQSRHSHETRIENCRSDRTPRENTHSYLSLSIGWRFSLSHSLEKSFSLSIVSKREQTIVYLVRPMTFTHNYALIICRSDEHREFEVEDPRLPALSKMRSFLSTRIVSSNSSGSETTTGPSRSIGGRNACAEPKIFKMSLWHFSHRRHRRSCHCGP